MAFNTRRFDGRWLRWIDCARLASDPSQARSLVLEGELDLDQVVVLEGLSGLPVDDCQKSDLTNEPATDHAASRTAAGTNPNRIEIQTSTTDSGLAGAVGCLVPGLAGSSGWRANPAFAGGLPVPCVARACWRASNPPVIPAAFFLGRRGAQPDLDPVGSCDSFSSACGALSEPGFCPDQSRNEQMTHQASR